MAFDQTTRNRLNRFVADARKLLANEFTRQLQAIYGMNPVTGDVADIKTLMGLTPSQQESAQLLRDTFEHYLASSEKGKEKERRLAALDRIVREQAFTVLNRIAALRMSEARGFLIESLANGYESKGFQLFHESNIFYSLIYQKVSYQTGNPQDNCACDRDRCSQCMWCHWCTQRSCCRRFISSRRVCSS